MKITIQLFTSLFLVILLSSLVVTVFANDGYGNYIRHVEVYQNGLEKNDTDYDEYEANYEIYDTNYLWDNWRFEVLTYVNSSVIEYNAGIVQKYQAVGLQILNETDDSIYAKPITPSPKILLPEFLPVETVNWVSETLEFSTFETQYTISITLWHNYEATGNITDWVLSETWVFKLIGDNYLETPEEPEPQNFNDLFFWGFISCLFICPLSIAGAIKMRNPKMIKVTVYSFIFLLGFFFIIIGYKPFGS